MFKHRFTYTNNRNETWEFGESSGVYLDESNLFDYAWDAVTAQGRLAAVTRTAREIPVSLLFLLRERDAGRVNDFDDLIDYDCRMGKEGTLELNGWQLPGVFASSAASEYQWRPGLMRREMVFLATSPDWTRRTVQSFAAASESSQGSLDFPHDFPHDWTAANHLEQFHNPSAFPAQFLLRIYGPCDDPYVIIGGNTYQVAVHLSEGEQLVIDSMDHSQILKVGVYGQATNVFDDATLGAPGSGDYIFEPIPPGSSALARSSGFRFDVELVELRSTPRWYEEG